MKRVVRAVLGLLIVLSVCGGCQEDSRRPPVVAHINGQEVPLQLFLSEFKASLGGHDPVAPARRLELQRAFMARLVDRVLLQQQARELQVEVSQMEIDSALAAAQQEYPEGEFEAMLQAEGSSLDRWRQGLAHRLLVEKLMTEVTADQVVVADEDVQGYFEAHREDYRRPYQVRARQLVVATKEEGEAALERLRQGEDFATVAREVSLSPDAADGGDLGFFAREEMPPEFDKVVFRLKKGRLSDLVKTPFGYHVFLVEERRWARTLKLEQVEPEIRQRLEREKAEELYQQWLRRIRSQARIDIDWSLLAQQQ